MKRAILICLLATPLPLAAVAGDIRFKEVADAWGLKFRHHHGGSGELYMVETMGSGVAIFDYDGDGDSDVLFVDSGGLPGYAGEKPRTVLYRNDGKRFVDVTDRAGIRVAAYGMGATAGDVDADGDLDLYITAFGPNQLFANLGDGTFRDVTEKAGVGDSLLGASAGFADSDRDGDLDLYVTNYVDFSVDNNPVCGNEKRGIRTYCHPDAFDGLPDRYFRNRGDGTFVDATAEAGFAQARGKGLGVLFTDVDEDGWLDLYVGNDTTPNFLFRNRGDGAFEEVAALSGTALDDRGNPEASMGLDAGDLDGDQLPELMATHMDDETNAVYGYQGSWVFVDRRFASRLAEPSVNMVGFGVVFADFDADRRLDVAVANGHIIHNIERISDHITYRQRNQVFRNEGARFAEVRDSGLEIVRASRGLAAGDLDRDGDPDLVISNSNDVAEVYENTSAGQGHWLQVDLRQGRGNRHAVGARVGAEGGGRRQWREVRTASSYLSQNSMTLHFGVGETKRVEALRVRWPDGTVRVVHDVPADRRVRIER